MPDMTISNGPLPKSLAARAYVSSSGKEFALPPDATIEYLRWLQEQRKQVYGMEAWIPTIPGPTPLVGVGCDGDAMMCIAAIPKIVAEFGPNIVFNVTCQA